MYEPPRVYTSFAEFERDERRRMGLEEIDIAVVVAPPKDPVPTPVAITRTQAAASKRSSVTPASLRSEGVLEIGCATGTSVLFVRTKVKIHLLHTTSLPDRVLDDYAVSMAVNWIESHGMASYEVARNLGVTDTTLRNALSKAGYERITASQRQGLVTARAARKPGRRGRLARVSAEASP